MRDIPTKAISCLQRAGSNKPRLDVDLLLAEALGRCALDIVPEPTGKVSQCEVALFTNLLTRRTDQLFLPTFKA